MSRLALSNWRAGASQPSRTTGTIISRAPIPQRARNFAMLDAVRMYMCCCSTPRARALTVLQLAGSACASRVLQLLPVQQLAALLVVGLHKQPYCNHQVLYHFGSLPLANNVQHSASYS